MTVRSAGGTLEREDDIAYAWERFVGGDDHVSGVAPGIVRSWYRCREQYRVDPGLREAPSAPARPSRSSLYDNVVFAELGGSAVSIMRETENLGSIVTVSDGAGRILATWGDREALNRGRESNLAPLSGWAEGTSGTNGIGTALESSGTVLVRGAEHWCQGFHSWVCAGAAVRDAVTDEPAAVLSISRWEKDLPTAATDWLSRAIAEAEVRLRRCAMDVGRELIAAFGSATRPPRGGLAAVDRAGKVVLADDLAGMRLDVPASAPALHPDARMEAGLAEVARLVSEQTDNDPSWVGSCVITTRATEEPVPVTIRPVFTAGRLIGSLVSFTRSADAGASEGNLPSVTASDFAVVYAQRLVATRGDRSVLLRPAEVRFAEAAGNDVWLNTDRGRVQASMYSLDRLEGEFNTSGFLRVHRRFMVNLNRVREVERGFKGELFLILEGRDSDSIPVSRRNAALVRRVLGISA